MKLVHKEYGKIFATHCAALFLAGIVFVGFFHTGIFDGVAVLFYKGAVIIAVTSTLLAAGMLYLVKKKLPRLISVRDVILSVVLFSSIAMVGFTHLPVTADRSISVFILGYMNSRQDQPITAEEMERVFIERYVKRYKAMQRRFDEQLVSGNVKRVSGGFVLTDQGRSVVGIYDVLCDLFLVDPKFVRPGE